MTGKPDSPRSYKCDNIGVALKQLVSQGWDLSTESFKNFVLKSKGYITRYRITEEMLDDEDFRRRIIQRIYKYKQKLKVSTSSQVLSTLERVALRCLPVVSVQW